MKVGLILLLQMQVFVSCLERGYAHDMKIVLGDADAWEYMINCFFDRDVEEHIEIERLNTIHHFLSAHVALQGVGPTHRFNAGF